MRLRAGLFAARWQLLAPVLAAPRAPPAALASTMASARNVRFAGNASSAGNAGNAGKARNARNTGFVYLSIHMGSMRRLRAMCRFVHI
jgi:hypothetical protein